MKRLALLISAAVGLALASAANAQTVIKAGHGAQTGHPTHFGLQKFAELVAAKTGGKVKVETLSSFSRDLRLRAKTATPAVIAKYLSDFIADVARKTKPNRH